MGVSQDFTRITNAHHAEASLSKLGLDSSMIESAIRHADTEDMRIDNIDCDPTHRAVNRWGHVLFYLRRSLKPTGWSRGGVDEDGLPSLISPDGKIRVAVASAVWTHKGPQTNPKGTFTIQAVADNQLWLAGMSPSMQVSQAVTLFLCLGRNHVEYRNDGTTKKVAYRCELSAPDGTHGKGARQRIVSWHYRCFIRTVVCRRPLQLAASDRYDDVSMALDDQKLTRK
jgi:hypothetical protein